MERLTFNETMNLLSKVTNKKNSIYPRALVCDSNYFGKFKIVKYEYSEPYKSGDRIKRRNYFKIKFIETGFETIAHLKSINDGSVKDNMVRNVHNIGFLGKDYETIREKDTELFLSLYNRWYNMINRCYNPKNTHYDRYGAIGVYICDRWHNFSKFYKDAIKMKNYDRDMVISSKLTIDKDALQQNKSNEKVYSPETCIWLDRKDQQAYINQVAKTVNQQTTFKWEDPDGNTGTYTNIKEFCRMHDLHDRHVGECIKGQRKSHKGWHFYPVD